MKTLTKKAFTVTTAGRHGCRCKQALAEVLPKAILLSLIIAGTLLLGSCGPLVDPDRIASDLGMSGDPNRPGNGGGGQGPGPTPGNHTWNFTSGTIPGWTHQTTGAGNATNANLPGGLILTGAARSTRWDTTAAHIQPNGAGNWGRINGPGTATVTITFGSTGSDGVNRRLQVNGSNAGPTTTGDSTERLTHTWSGSLPVTLGANGAIRVHSVTANIGGGGDLPGTPPTGNVTITVTGLSAFNGLQAGVALWDAFGDFPVAMNTGTISGGSVTVTLTGVSPGLYDVDLAIGGRNIVWEGFTSLPRNITTGTNTIPFSVFQQFF